MTELVLARLAIRRETNRLKNEFLALQNAMSAIVGSNALQGQVKNSIDIGIVNQHLPIIVAFIEILDLMAEQINDDIEDFNAHMNEGSVSAIYTDSVLPMHLRILSNGDADKNDMDAQIRSIYSSISEYIDLRMPSNMAYEAKHQRAYRHISKFISDFGSFPQNPPSAADTLLDQLTTQVTRLSDVVGRAFNDPGRMAVANNTDFRNQMVNTQMQRALTNQALLEQLMEQWLNNTPASSLINLPRPLQPQHLQELMGYINQQHYQYEAFRLNFEKLFSEAPTYLAITLGTTHFGDFLQALNKQANTTPGGFVSQNSSTFKHVGNGMQALGWIWVAQNTFSDAQRRMYGENGLHWADAHALAVASTTSSVVGGVVGKSAGVAAGTGTGKTIGGAIGIFFGPLGLAAGVTIGGVVGGFVGGLTGSVVGSWFGREVFEGSISQIGNPDSANNSNGEWILMEGV